MLDAVSRAVTCISDNGHSSCVCYMIIVPCVCLTCGNFSLQVVKTHLRNMIIVPEMIGSVVGVYNGKAFNQIEIKV